MVIGLPLSTWQEPLQRVSQAPGTNGKLLEEFIPLRWAESTSSVHRRAENTQGNRGVADCK